MAEVRGELQRLGRSTEHPGWQRALDGDFVLFAAKGDRAAARELLLRELDASDLIEVTP
jgi:hypothetical protein